MPVTFDSKVKFAWIVQCFADGDLVCIVQKPTLSRSLIG